MPIDFYRQDCSLGLYESKLAVSSVLTMYPRPQTIFYVYKGVKTFAYSENYNILVTGGMDRLVRIWNPYVNT